MAGRGSETAQRAAVVAEARRWIGTPYHPGADVRGAGVDCGMLLVRVYADSGVVPAFDPRPYPPDWHLHRDDERYLAIVRRHCASVAPAAAQAGDIALFRYGRCHAHGAILTDPGSLTMVHAFSPAGLVIEEPLARNATLADPARAPRFFSPWRLGTGDHP